jgi:hypothetical protein
MAQFKITGDYGSFTVTKTVEAVDEDAAFAETGITDALNAHGWHVEGPDGEEWEIVEVTGAV